VPRPRRLAAAIAAAAATALLGAIPASAQATAPQDATASYSLSVTASAMYLRYGLTDTITATVRDGNAPVTSGTITFYGDNSAILATARPNSHGQATYTLASNRLALGMHNLSISYTDAGGTFQGIADPGFPITVIKNTPALAYSPRPIPTVSHLKHARYQVWLTSPGTTVTGTLRIYNGRTLIGSASLSHGHATVVLGRLARGLHTLTFHYSGNQVLNAQTWTNIMLRVS
jgi:hypothetical protein